MTALLGMVIALQVQSASAPRSAPVASRQAPASVGAVRAATAPVLDGRDDDPVWQAAPLVDEFVQSQPTEGAAPTFRTTARLAYDEHNFYVFVRAFDPRPDSIVRLLARRDDDTPSDRLTVFLDSYHDRRTGYGFAVNPAGVKADYAIYNDGNMDQAWDAIWDVAIRVDSLGWTAEYRIPLSQLRYSSQPSASFGLLVRRTIQRYTQTVSWPAYRPSSSGFVSQFGDVTGLDGLGSPGRAEVTPYVLTRNVQGPAAGNYARNQDVTIGGDLRYRLASNLLANATVNPDFGQVEADPSVLNLGAFETFFDERRPFFVEGKGLFTFSVNCVVVVDCRTGEGLFYSRRIGRSPQLAGTYGDESSATASRILGAAKVTGRLPNGFSLGVLDAVTDRVEGPGGLTTLEPTTNYGVMRGNQDYNGGAGSVGFIVTGVNRALDPSSEAWLHRSAYTGGLDARHRFGGGRFEISGLLSFSRVAGNAAAIALTQQTPVHLYQRPDGPLTFDPTRTSLSGTAQEVRLAKVGGNFQFETAYQRRSPGFEINDVGFLRQADQQEFTNWAAFAFRRPNRVFQQLRWNLNNWEHWSLAGLPTDRAANTNVHVQFNNRWWLHTGITVGNIGSTYCDRCARGGPAIRQDRYVSNWAGVQGDDRKVLVPSVFSSYMRGDQGRSETWSVSPSMELKVSTRFTTSFRPSYERNRNDVQYFGTFEDADGAPHFAFARLDQRTLSFTWRVGYTFTPSASLQIYASPFISKGTYRDVREVADARAAAYTARYQPYADEAVAANPGGFNVQQFRSNAVFRWEYRPGSTLFLVWSQGREGSSNVEGAESFRRDFADLFGRRANNTFLVKLSYWLAR
ncbi:MAG: carbohydrate binding family 9 domain-containing protein [Gemmatimonadales bacterium]|nr:carbohydrate binding family 9 domain-containing protein [Gemmatimonadales bacterium]